MAVLALRVALALWALPVSAWFPHTPLEQQVSVVPGGAPPGTWLQRVFVMPWVRYDVWNYIRIATHGYHVDEGTAAFHPLYPLLAVPLKLLGGNVALALLLVATLSSVALCILFTRYVEHVHGGDRARPAAWLLFAAPPSFILLAPYNESTFLALAVGAVWAMHSERWWLAGLLGGLAALTRQQGLALALPLAWGLLVALRARRARLWEAGALALIPLGYGLFVVYRAIALGDLGALAQTQGGPVGFIHHLLVSHSSEQVVSGQHIAWPWEPLIAEIRLIFTTPDAYDLVIDLVLGWAVVLVVLLGLRGMTMPERLYSLAIVALALCYYNGDRAPYLSLPRHVLLAFPLFVVLARWAGQGRRLRVLVEVLLIANLFLAAAFVRHGWVP